MLLLKAQNIYKSIGVRTLFRAEKLELHDGDRVGLVGANGAGKSTLMELLCGTEACDSGIIERRCEIALVRQPGTEQAGDKTTADRGSPPEPPDGGGNSVSARARSESTDGGNSVSDRARSEDADDGTELADDGTELADDGTELADDGTELADDGTELADDSTGLADGGTELANDSTGLADGAVLSDGTARAMLPSTGARHSGGETTRFALAEAFAKRAPLLLLDEPTTDLDLVGVERLERMISGYRGAVLVVSHDRELLERVCTVIWSIEDEKIRVFPGGYTLWEEQRERERQTAQADYEEYRGEKKRLEQEMRQISQKASKMTKAPSRMGNSEARLHKGSIPQKQGKVSARAGTMRKRIDMLEEAKRPSDLPEIRMSLGAASTITSKTAARIEDLTVRYDGRVILDSVSFELPTGSHTILLGENGAGKTTLLRCLIAAADDHIRIANGVQIGYFSQNHDILEPGRSVLDNARADSSLPEHEVRTILARLGVSGDDVRKPAGVLSGGERAKAVFARLLASDCNLLILDEPTNHIDLYTADALCALLRGWRGTLLAVTHDRRFAATVGDRFLRVADGGITEVTPLL